ncbi:MAG: MFS transporter [Vulcanisaeta sp.]|jgi:MFS family permease|uniref:MFS transporter n=1 Tax=Vulcanisaeta sp. TaxID=2020871 RepID=UPI003D0DFA5A
MRNLVVALFSVVGTVSIWFNFLAYNVITSIFVAFIARPIGAYVFGLIGDKHSSKSSLALTLIVMGISTMLISTIEKTWYATYELLMLRIAQGLALGGEWALWLFNGDWHY